MKKSFKNYLCLLLSLCLASPAFGLSPLDVMDKYSGTRAMAMGGAFVAVADDINAPYWNPAGLTQVVSNQLGTTYVNLFGMVDRLSIDSIYQFEEYQTVLAINYAQEGMQNIPKTVDVGGTGIQIGSFDEYKRAVNIGLAKKYDKVLSWGLNGRFLYNTLDTEFAYGGSADAGLLWNIDNTLYFGLVARNILSRLVWSTSKLEYLERKLVLGISVQDDLLKIPAVFAFDYEINAFSNNKWYLGTELWLAPDLFAFRFGTNSDERWTFGTGLKYGNMTFDICYWQQEYLGQQYLLSICYDFDPYASGQNGKKRRTIPAKITPTSIELHPGQPLLINVQDTENKIKKVAVSFPGSDKIKKMQKTKTGFQLTHSFTKTPPLYETQTAKIYIQDLEENVSIETIQYTYIPKPVIPKIALARTTWYRGEKLRIKMTVPKDVKVSTAVVEFDELHSVEMESTAPGIYRANYLLSEKLKYGTYQARILVKIGRQPVYEKIIQFKITPRPKN